MTAAFCRNAADRTAGTWAEQLAPFVALEFAVSELPTYDFWELLHADPVRLAQQLSTQAIAE